ncbi:MAG: AAA family ATPase [Candidatus Hydrogenedentota bacterium]
MYEAFYGLDERPFNLTPDPRYLYLSDKHKEAFAHLVYGINNRSGFVMVSGEIGTGKTTLCRSLLEQLDEDTEVAFIFNPFLSPLELLGKINEEFGVPSSAETAKGLIDELNAYLLDRAAQGINCVLVIDEAQNLEPRVLEQIRLLSNLETSTQKLLQIILIGQPELAQHLALPELRQLNQRITARYHLKALNRQETMQYIAFRLRAAGGRRKVTFTRGALKLIHRYSGGTPRVINALCDRALLIGYTQDVHDITASIVRKAHREIRGERVEAPKPAKQRRFRLAPLAAAAAVVGLLGGAIFYSVYYTPSWLESSARHAVQTIAFDMGGYVAAEEPPAPEAREEAPAEEPDAPAPVEPEEPEQDSSGEADGFDALDPELARNAAAASLLRMWDVSLTGEYPEEGTAEGLAAFAGEHGLEYEILSPSFEQLININLPSFVRLASDRQTLWAGLLEIRDGEAVLAKRIGETFTMPLAEFQNRYTNQSVIVWRDPEPDPGVLSASSEGEQVEALQTQLRGLGWLNHEATGQYDAETREAVRALQEETGLQVDGVAGPQTRMVLTSWARDAQTPALMDVDDDESWAALAAAAPEAEFRIHMAARADGFSEDAEALAEADEEDPAEPQEPDADDEPAAVDAVDEPEETAEAADELAGLSDEPAADGPEVAEVEADDAETGAEPAPAIDEPEEPADEGGDSEDAGDVPEPPATDHPFMMQAEERPGIGDPGVALLESLSRGTRFEGDVQPREEPGEDAEGEPEQPPEDAIEETSEPAEDPLEDPSSEPASEQPESPDAPEAPFPEYPALPDRPVAEEPTAPVAEEPEPSRSPSSLWPTDSEITVPEPQGPEAPSVQRPEQPSMPDAPSWPERPEPPTRDSSSEPRGGVGSPPSIRMDELPPAQRLESLNSQDGATMDGEDEEGS